MSIIVETPFQNFVGLDGKPLTNGKVYIGQVGTDPTVPANQIPVFWDEAMTIPASQPLTTNAGYIVRTGTPSRVYVGSDHSMSVKNASGILVYYVDEFNIVEYVTKEELASSAGSTLVGELSSATGASLTTAHQKFADIGISMVADYKAVPDAYGAATNNTAAVQAFMNAQEIDTRTGFVPDGAYAVTDIQCGNIATTGNRFPGGQGPGIYHLHGTDRERCQFVALSGTNTVLNRNNLAGIKISGLGVNARDIANVGMDFSWIPIDGDAAPSNGNVFSDITVNSARITSMVMDEVYDTDFKNLKLIGSPIGLSIRGTGGQHNLTTSLMTGLLQASAQNMFIDQCSLFGGVDINGSGPNMFAIVGTQIFPTQTSASIPSYKWGMAIDATDSGTFGASMRLTDCFVFGGEGAHCIQGKFNLGIIAENCQFSYGIGANMFNAITGNGTSRPLMSLRNCAMPTTGTPLGTNPATYDWEMINCFVGNTYVKYASNLTEGFWNPTGIGVTLTVNSVGTWVRSGNMVTAFFDITIPANTSTNPGAIGGIPFSRVGTSSAGAFSINTYGATRLTLDISGSTIITYTSVVAVPTYQDLSGVRFKGYVTYLCANPMDGV